MKKIFVDLGAHKGTFSKEAIAKLEGFEVIAFEPCEMHWPDLEKIEGLTLYKVAAWDKDAENVPLYLGQGAGKGTTMMPNKTTGGVNYKKPMYVNTIDFSRWIDARKDCFIVVKMNIEGAEFPIIEKMIKDDTLKYIDMLVYSDHSQKIQFDGSKISNKVRDTVKTFKKYADPAKTINQVKVALDAQ